MGAVAMVRRMVGLDAGQMVETLTAERSVLKAAAVAGAAEAARLEAQADLEADFDRAEALRLEARRAHHAVSHAEARLPALEAKLQDAKAAAQHALLRRLLPERIAEFKKLAAALEAAAAAQHAAMKHDETACRLLGEGIARKFLPPVGYNGLVLADFVATWKTHNSRALDGAAATIAAMAPQPASVPVAVAAAPMPPEPKPVPKAPPPRTASQAVTAPTPPTPRVRPPLPAIEGDTVRVVALRSGIEHGGEILAAGDVTLMPRAEALEAMKNGAVDLAPQEELK